MRINYSLLFVAMCLFFLSCQAPSSTQVDETPAHPTDVYLARGQEIASKVFGTLIAEVSKNMKAHGVAATISYCNAQAYPITDSLAAIHHAHIKRTSHKIRNPRNAPDSLESAMLADYLASSEKGLEMPPQLVEEGKEVHFFAPIMMAEGCLKCHGTAGKELDVNDLAVIQQYYPEDKATGYVAGELRGIWSISFERQDAISKETSLD